MIFESIREKEELVALLNSAVFVQVTAGAMVKGGSIVQRIMDAPIATPPAERPGGAAEGP